MAMLMRRYPPGAGVGAGAVRQLRQADLGAGLPVGADSEERRAATPRSWSSRWDWEADMLRRCPSADPPMQRWWAQRMRAAATPSTVRALMDMNALVDVRDALAAVRVPTLVLHRPGDALFRVEEAPLPRRAHPRRPAAAARRRGPLRLRRPRPDPRRRSRRSCDDCPAAEPSRRPRSRPSSRRSGRRAERGRGRLVAAGGRRRTAPDGRRRGAVRRSGDGGAGRARAACAQAPGRCRRSPRCRVTPRSGRPGRDDRGSACRPRRRPGSSCGLPSPRGVTARRVRRRDGVRCARTVRSDGVEPGSARASRRR